MINKDTRRLIAEACDDILSCGENKRFWRKMKSVALNASDEDFEVFMQETSKRKNGLELLIWLDIQVGFINELNSLCDVRDFQLGEHSAVFHISEEESDLYKILHLTEDRVKRYNINREKFKIDKIIRTYFADSNIVEVNKKVDEPDKEYRDGFTSETKDVTVYPKEEDKIIAQGKNYKITQKYSEYTDDNGITMVYPSIAKNILNKDKGE